jgi:signal transduction histidine kinase
VDYRARTRAGEVRWLRTVGRPRDAGAGTVIWDGLTLDITEEVRRAEDHKALEARLRQTQKMDSLGTLAGGATHEFNNLLVPITMLTELAMGEIDENGQAYKHLAKVVENADRASKIINQILSFSRSGEPERKPVDLAVSLREAVDLLRATLPATIAVSLDVPADPCPVVADNTQLQQVLMNLCSNAKQAIGENKIGDIAIGLSRVDVGASMNALRVKAGAYARISVRDSGHGMDAKTLSRIFEPFFTTKPVGQGAGLGLAVIHGIVAAHGGAIDVKSEVGKGTTFEIYLPIHDDASSAMPAGTVRPISAVAANA